MSQQYVYYACAAFSYSGANIYYPDPRIYERTVAPANSKCIVHRNNNKLCQMTHVQSRDRLFIRLSSFKLVFKNEKKRRSSLLDYYAKLLYSQSVTSSAQSSEGHLAGHGHLGLSTAPPPPWRSCLWHCWRCPRRPQPDATSAGSLLGMQLLTAASNY